VGTPHETKLNKNISTVADGAHHSIDRVAGATVNAENDVLTAVRDSVKAAKDARSATKAGVAAGKAQARSAVTTFNDRASQHPGVLFAVGAGLALGAVLLRAALQRRR
jgi:hypothetical protein